MRRPGFCHSDTADTASPARTRRVVQSHLDMAEVPQDPSIPSFKESGGHELSSPPLPLEYYAATRVAAACGWLGAGADVLKDSASVRVAGATLHSSSNTSSKWLSACAHATKEGTLEYVNSGQGERPDSSRETFWSTSPSTCCLTCTASVPTCCAYCESSVSDSLPSRSTSC